MEGKLEGAGTRARTRPDYLSDRADKKMRDQGFREKTG